MTIRRFLPDRKTFILVTIVAALIWVWAEGESLTSDDLTTTVQFKPAAGSIVVQPAAGFTGALSIRLEGTTLAIDAARRRFSREALPFEPGVGSLPVEPGAYRINMRDALRQHPEIRPIGISVIDVQPADVDVQIVRLVTESMDVVWEAADGIDVTTVAPKQVRVSLPENLLVSLGDDPKVSVQLTDEDVRGITPGGRATLRRPVRLPEPLRGRELVRVLDNAVDVTLVVRAKVDRYTVPDVPVWVFLPPTQVDKWDIELIDQNLTDVVVEGPSEIIARVRDRQLPVKAFVELDAEDLNQRIESKAVQFSNLPSLVRCDPGLEARRVRLRIQPRDTGPPPGGE